MLINSAPWTWQMCKIKVHSYWYHIDFMFWLAFDSPAEPRLSGVVDSVIESLGSPQRIRVVKFQLIDPLSWIGVRPCIHLLMTIPPEEKRGLADRSDSLRFIHLYVGIMQEVGGPVSTERPLRPACISGSPSSPSSLSSSVMYSSESSSLSEMWTVTWRRR